MYYWNHDSYHQVYFAFALVSITNPKWKPVFRSTFRVFDYILHQVCLCDGVLLIMYHKLKYISNMILSCFSTLVKLCLKQLDWFPSAPDIKTTKINFVVEFFFFLVNTKTYIQNNFLRLISSNIFCGFQMNRLSLGATVIMLSQMYYDFSITFTNKLHKN